VRFERMRGRDVLWQPGMDHAGIATQMVVERQLMERQIHRRDLGREAFIEKVWEWKAESGGAIVNQLEAARRLLRLVARALHHGRGPVRGRARSVRQLYKEGLIYKDKRLVNWDPKLLTAISDLEVEQVEVKGNLWHFRYPLEGKNFDPEEPENSSSPLRPRVPRRCSATRRRRASG
jgi:valyl-tRNA synthetase